MGLFSRRNLPVPDQYRYEIPENARIRLIHTIRERAEDYHSHLDFRGLMDDVQNQLIKAYGQLRTQRRGSSGHPALDHFVNCDHEEVLDFLVMCFQTRGQAGGQRTVDELNRIFEDENIGYELTPFGEEQLEDSYPDWRPAGTGPKLPTFRYIFPTAIKKDEKILHQEMVKPCLHALSDKRFGTANGELLSAFEEYRKGEYGDAITDAGAAFESVLKIICTAKKWPYDKEKDTCSRILDICREKGLLHGFYKQILEGTATIRNKVGDAHGKGPKSEYPATKELAEHMLYTVCNNINLVISLAKL